MTQPSARAWRSRASRWRPWIAVAGALLLGGSIVIVSLSDGSISLYAGTVGVAAGIGNLLLAYFWRGASDDTKRAGASHALPSWRASRGWTAPSFKVDRRDYDPDGAAWAELVEIARSHGYELAAPLEPTDETWHFARPAPTSDTH